MVMVSFGLRNERGPRSAPGAANIFGVLPPSAFPKLQRPNGSRPIPSPSVNSR